MGCLHQAVPDRVNAEGSSALWNPPLRGGAQVVRRRRRRLPDFEIITFNSGGTGARPTKDGLDGTAFPSGVRTMPVEATENVAPVIFWQKELRAGFRRRRPHPRRLRPGHGDRRQGRCGVRRQRHLRPRRQCAEGPRGRRRRRAGLGRADDRRHAAAHQGLPGDPEGAAAAAEAARRRRHGRPEGGATRRWWRATWRTGWWTRIRRRCCTAAERYSQRIVMPARSFACTQLRTSGGTAARSHCPAP